MRNQILGLALLTVASLADSTQASAKSCAQLRALCTTMRDDPADCAGPYRRCLKTGVFITPLGRVFRATR